jgi:hypothetical protein
MIGANFFVQCLQAQMDPKRRRYSSVWEVVEHVFNFAFAIELGFNLYGHWFIPFFVSKRRANGPGELQWWNIFDVVVVSIGLLDSTNDLLDAILQCSEPDGPEGCVPLPGPLRLVRMIRAFRAFRLFGKVESLKKIIVSLRMALPGVLNAFMITLIILAIYAVCGVNFFRIVYLPEEDLDGDAPGSPAYDPVMDCSAAGSHTPLPLFTGRAICFGEDYYGTFMASMYTLFQVLTGESWSEAIARPHIHFYKERDSPDSMAGAAMFYVSFYLLNTVVLMNIIIALLIDGMAQKPATEEPGPDQKAGDPGKDADGQDGEKGENGGLSEDAVDVDVPAPETPQDQITELTKDVADAQEELNDFVCTLRYQVDFIVAKAVKLKEQQRP